MGMALGFPTIMLPAVQSGNDSVTFTPDQASWFASLMFIFQPAGSLISSLILGWLGRKNTLILINIPYFFVWVTIHLSETVYILMICSIVLAVNIGYLETPAINYVGEISTPKLRGILTSYSAPIIYMGIIFEFILGKLFDWRTVALINSTIPILTIAAMIQIPESPMWLLSKGRNDKAKSALCWLRGWVKPELILTEFKYLINYKEVSSERPMTKVYTIDSAIDKNGFAKNNNIDDVKYFREENVKTVDVDTKKPCKFYNVAANGGNTPNTTCRRETVRSSLSIMFNREYVKPFILVSMYFLFYYMSGVPSIRPYLLLIINEMQIPIDPKVCVIFVPTTGFIGSIVSMCIIKRIGKRPLSLISIGGTAFSALTCGILSYKGTVGSQILPFIMLLLLAFFTSIGIAAIPWMLLSEVFPLRGRGIASGLVATVAYALAFATAKTFLDLHMRIGLHGVFFLYGSCSVFGLIYLYIWLPETEGKTLHEIELHFKQKKSKVVQDA
ncbi:facilitated trehalose transporter Tret1 isoform X1 [Diaphorina citri]|uniref:Facilitated trehalose transporter Tret1 isoform X1 n=2 Tax=Diaphorina citri TaxID=121845 RepID=A0A1S3CW62_DIACI|nr:facilitated trehalose transporter Tret1 isoform X1 [Diaphorina citri]